MISSTLVVDDPAIDIRWTVKDYLVNTRQSEYFLFIQGKIVDDLAHISELFAGSITSLRVQLKPRLLHLWLVIPPSDEQPEIAFTAEQRSLRSIIPDYSRYIFFLRDGNVKVPFDAELSTVQLAYGIFVTIKDQRAYNLKFIVPVQKEDSDDVLEITIINTIRTVNFIPGTCFVQRSFLIPLLDRSIQAGYYIYDYGLFGPECLIPIYDFFDVENVPKVGEVKIKKIHEFQLDNPSFLLDAKKKDLDQYLKVASIYSEEDLKDFRDCIAKVRSEIPNAENNNAPFIFVCAPSGTGKTQLTYAANENNIPMIRIVLKGSQDQPIYSINRKLSEEFIWALTADYYHLQRKSKSENLMKSCDLFSKYSQIELKSLGLLDFLLRLHRKDAIVSASGNPIKWDHAAMCPYIDEAGNDQIYAYPSISFCDFTKLWNKDNLLREDSPCFVLDEFNLSNESIDLSDGMMVFARNLLRAIGTVCIIMGTESKASNVISPLSTGNPASSKKPSKIPWCYVFSRLPRAKAKNVPGHDTLFAFKNSIIESCNGDSVKIQQWECTFNWLDSIVTSRPRFLEYAFGILVKIIEESDSYSAIDLLSEALKMTSIDIMEGKAYFNTEKGILGQLMMMFPRWTTDLAYEYLINCHFADLAMPNDVKKSYFPLFRRGPNLKISAIGEGATWKPKSIFPKLETDEFMYLVLISCWSRTHNIFGIVENEKTCSLFEAYTEIYLREVSRLPVTENIHNQENNEGPLLENVVHLAAIFASHQSGLKCSRLDEFIAALTKGLRDPNLYAMKDESWETVVSKLNPLCHLATMKGRERLPVVPFLGPMNRTYANMRSKIPGLNIGELLYARDSEQIDGKIYDRMGKYLIGLECKYLKKKLSTKEIMDIICKSFGRPGHDNPEILLIFVMHTKFHSEDLQKLANELEDEFKRATGETRESLRNTLNTYYSFLEANLILSVDTFTKSVNEDVVSVSTSVFRDNGALPSYFPGQKIVVIFPLQEIFGASYALRDFLKRSLPTE